jgi:hypothetical protein
MSLPGVPGEDGTRGAWVSVTVHTPNTHSPTPSPTHSLTQHSLAHSTTSPPPVVCREMPAEPVVPQHPVDLDDLGFTFDDSFDVVDAPPTTSSTTTMAVDPASLLTSDAAAAPSALVESWGLSDLWEDAAPSTPLSIKRRSSVAGWESEPSVRVHAPLTPCLRPTRSACPHLHPRGHLHCSSCRPSAPFVFLGYYWGGKKCFHTATQSLTRFAHALAACPHVQSHSHAWVVRSLHTSRSLKTPILTTPSLQQCPPLLLPPLRE